MKKLIALLAIALASLNAFAADDPGETPAQCKKRVGSLRECFASQIAFHQEMCRLAVKIASMSPTEEYLKKAVQCGGNAKNSVRPFYEATLLAAKKPSQSAAVKKTMQAFFAVMSDPPGTVGLRNNLETALAELEIELP
jgi:hypothetical protein